MVIFFYSFCRMDKVYTYSVHWGGIVHIQEKVNYPQRKGELPTMEGRIEIRPHRNLPILHNSPMLQIRSHYNSPMWMGELQFAPTRMLSERWQIYI